MKREDIHMSFGLKWNPFTKDLPVEGMITTAKINKFCWRIENLVMGGGFALITGSSGLGKSIALRIIEDRLSKLREIEVGSILRPQSGLPDFYREMCHHFGLEYRGSNRWNGFKTLRQKWIGHIESTLFRPVLLIDEAQEMPANVLSEIRFLSAAKFDSKTLLSVILAGDERLNEKFRSTELQPLGSRIGVRLTLEPASKEELVVILSGCLEKAGNPKLMTEEVINSLAEHAAGNFRIMMNMALELLVEAFKQDAKKIDEKIFFEAFQKDQTKSPRNLRRIAK